jgi:hypothetical protein
MTAVVMIIRPTQKHYLNITNKAQEENKCIQLTDLIDSELRYATAVRIVYSGYNGSMGPGQTAVSSLGTEASKYPNYIRLSNNHRENIGMFDARGFAEKGRTGSSTPQTTILNKAFFTDFDYQFSISGVNTSSGQQSLSLKIDCTPMIVQANNVDRDEDRTHSFEETFKFMNLRNKANIGDSKRPIGSFLFLGPTGVGKTELSKALAEALFGKEDAMIRIDMSEYMEKHSVSKIIGSPPGYVGYDEGGQLSEKVRRNPYSVILFDEIEKAHPDVFHILLQVLDDGHITDSQGRRVDFKNTIIIMTSNAGAQRIVEPKNLGFGKTNDVKADYETMKSHVMEEVKRLFRPEFLNRIDDILVFHPLSRDDMVSILDIMLKQLNARTKEAMGISITMSHKAKERMIGLGYSDKYGARPLRRALQTEIEDKLTDEVLMGNIKSGDHVSIREKEGSFIFAAS